MTQSEENQSNKNQYGDEELSGDNGLIEKTQEPKDEVFSNDPLMQI